MGILDSTKIPCTFNNRHLQAETDPEEGNVPGTGKFDRGNLAFHAPFPETRSNQDSVHT